MNRFAMPATILSAVVLISGAAHAADVRKPDKAQGGQPISLASVAAPEAPTLNRTDLAMKCWLGVIGNRGCSVGVCDPGGTGGPVERVEYLGSTAAGAQVYKVRYQSRIAAYRIVPDPSGNPDQYSVRATDHYWIKREITSRAAPSLIYTRPENAPPVYCWRDMDAFGSP